MSVSIEQNKTKKSEWSMEFNNSGPGTAVFLFKHKKIFEFEGLTLGILKESGGIEKKCRPHFSEKNSSHRIETTTFHPFGSEPVIDRKWEQFSNYFSITTDLQIKYDFPLKELNVDTLKILGKWQTLKIFFYKRENLSISVKNYNLADSKNKIEFTEIPLLLVFENENGFQLEIGTGFDLWRWNCSKKFNVSKNFEILIEDDFIYLTRSPLTSQDEFIIQKNNLRFNWYFSWKNNHEIIKNESIPVKTKLIYDGKSLTTETKNNSSLVFELIHDNKNSSANELYYCSKQFFNVFKTWLRSFVNKLESQNDFTIIFILKEPHVCKNGSHVGRSGQETKFIHWDYDYIFKLSEWANRFLSSTNTTFTVTFESGIFNSIPSASALESIK